MNEEITVNGYGVVRTVEDAKALAAKAQQEGLRGCYPAAAVVLANALEEAEETIRDLLQVSDCKEKR